MRDGGEGFQPKKILEVLARHDVACVVIGGIASTIHGSPFTTSDVDICPDLRATNLEKLASALNELQSRILVTDEPEGLQIEVTGALLRKSIPDFQFLHFMTKYGQIDLLYKPAGTEGYKDLVRNAVEGALGEVTVQIAALEDVIRSKQAAGRQRDLEHLPTLRKLLEISRE